MPTVRQIYRDRFRDEIHFRREMWRVLCRDYFQKLIPEDSTLLEVGAGYCEFINNIRARRKYALDTNPDTSLHAAPDVEVIQSPSTNISALDDACIDVIFMSNFLEHLPREEIGRTLEECHRCLVEGGRIVILQPNIRFLYRDFWMFPDHITPIDDRAVCELLRAIGFSATRSTPRFLPYTTKGRLPKSILLLKIYLRLPILHRLFGKQSLIVASK